MMEIKTKDDGKGKWQSWEAWLEDEENFGDTFTWLHGYGETEEEAKKELKEKLTSYLNEVITTLLGNNPQKIMEDKLEAFKKMYRKYNPNTMIEFASFVLYYTENPTSKMDIPNCVYEKVEKMYSDWNKRCEICVYYKDHVKAISEGKNGSAFCMLECNPSHSAFKEIQ